MTDSFKYCRVVANQMPSVDNSEKTFSRRWVGMISDIGINLWVDYFWCKVFAHTDASGDKFLVLPQLVKCALSLSHSNADVERSFSINKKMLTKQIMRMNDKTVTGLRAMKAVVYKCGGVTKVPISKELLKVTENSHHLYLECRM